jgi:hypothetical protein
MSEQKTTRVAHLRKQTIFKSKDALTALSFESPWIAESAMSVESKTRHAFGM